MSEKKSPCLSFNFLSDLVGDYVVAAEVDNMAGTITLRLRDGNSIPFASPPVVQLNELTDLFVVTTIYDGPPILTFRRMARGDHSVKFGTAP